MDVLVIDEGAVMAVPLYLLPSLAENKNDLPTQRLYGDKQKAIASYLLEYDTR